MSDVEAIIATMAEYAHLLDDGRLDEWADLYLEDGELDIAGQVLGGRTAIVEYLRTGYSAGSSTHIFSLPDIRVTGDQARAVADFLLVTNSSGAVSVGRVDDEWVRCPDRWRLRMRRISLKS
ncbi:MAG: nuclear transport factor 2 family protein [Acidimicrobiia bacterium]